MLFHGWFLCAFFALFFISFGSANSRVFRRLSMATYPTIYVDQSGHGNFSTIQSAIDFIPSNNGNWICVSVRAGKYREQVRIPMDKPYIYIKGDGKRKTTVVWDSHDSIATSPTFISQADNILVKSISFMVQETNGFVFKDCNVIGTGLTYLGRPWREYFRVIFYNSYLSDVVLPLGWNA
ncbi:putative pectinesterase 29 [Camellia lanceoleosa]|uniref:Pectinesterase 29 n=1 Tax=Camellia lanceoleosa TaxID=1840588 RepID=A0ACC0H9W2_9ERIC|nr:putative pectinesterase 29 [Camellia lanceoleosa]